jgi:hypothetical protein
LYFHFIKNSVRVKREEKKECFMPVTFGGEISTNPQTGKATISDKYPVQPKSPQEIMQEKAAQQQFAELQQQFQQTGNRPEHSQLNKLEQQGAKTFGTGMRGAFDYAGSGQQPYSRSDVSALRNTFNDPSLQVFDRNTGQNPLGLGVGQFANYYQGREGRLAETPMGKIFGGAANVANTALNASPISYLTRFLPEQFRQEAPNRIVPSHLEQELSGATLPPTASFSSPAGLASVRSALPSVPNFFEGLDLGALLNAANKQDNDLASMDTSGMREGGYRKAQDILDTERSFAETFKDQPDVYGGYVTYFFNELGQPRRVQGEAEMLQAIADGFKYSVDEVKALDIPSPPKDTDTKIFKRSDSVLDAFGDPLGALPDAEKEALKYIKDMENLNKLNPNYDPVVSSSSGLGAYVVPRSETAEGLLDRLMGGFDIKVEYDPSEDEFRPQPKPNR